MKSLKTPLRYPGGKSRALTNLFRFLPDLSQVTEYREPFIGGGSVAIEVAKRYPKLDIWINDLYEPLYNFWCELRDNGREMRDQLVQLKYRHCDPTSARVLFEQSKDYLNGTQSDTSNLSRAVAFYVINKCSFSGLTESSSFSKQASESNFSMRGIDRLPDFSLMIKDWKITNLSYEKLLTDDRDTFTYLDPPYDIKSNLYGRRGSMHKCFDHDTFAADCDRFVGPQCISYNSSNLVKERFQGWTVGEFAHTYTMRSVGSYNTDQASRKELILTNYEV
jgi:site-specific DNA-adenine methylase